jgi:hypothetical protein
MLITWVSYRYDTRAGRAGFCADGAARSTCHCRSADIARDGVAIVAPSDLQACNVHASNAFGCEYAASRRVGKVASNPCEYAASR